MKFSILALLLASSSLTLALPTTIVERRDTFPAAWKRASYVVNPEATIPLRIALTQQNLHRLDSELMRISDPSSEHYSKHWTPAEVRDFFAPTAETIDAVKTWLAEQGIKNSVKQSASKTWLMVDVTVAEAEQLLEAKYHAYENTQDGTRRIVTTSYSVPTYLREHIDIITPTLHFDHKDARGTPHNSKRSEKPAVQDGNARQIGSPDSGSLPKKGGPAYIPNKKTGAATPQPDATPACSSQITPSCLRQLYNFVNVTANNTASNSFGVVEYTPQAYVQSDLDLFLQAFSPSQAGQSPVIRLIDGATVQTTQTGFNYNGESNLDLQYAIALSDPQPVGLYQVGTTAEQASFNNFLDAIDGSYCTYNGGDDPTQDGSYSPENCGGAPLSNVFSTSYGYDEAGLTAFYEQRQCNEYAKLGMMGVSFVQSSGDYGVAGNSGNCLTSRGTVSSSGTIFNPAFPSTCPYVTSVGATQLNGTVAAGETACQLVIKSGGGFSNRFALPSYQATQVKNYLANYKPSYTTKYNSTGRSRGFPDVSSNGANYAVYVQGAASLVYGTSAAAPTFASILTLINDARIGAGKKPVGFINPTIYTSSFASAFNDITTGGNPGCGTNGFNASPGWDPVTGLGTPNFQKLKALWLALP